MSRTHHRHLARRIKMYDGHCAICPSDDHLDDHHIIPQCKGGKTVDDNLIILCKTHHDLFRLATLNIEELKKYQKK